MRVWIVALTFSIEVDLQLNQKEVYKKINQTIFSGKNVSKILHLQSNLLVDLLIYYYF